MDPGRDGPAVGRLHRVYAVLNRKRPLTRHDLESAANVGQSHAVADNKRRGSRTEFSFGTGYSMLYLLFENALARLSLGAV